MSDDISIGKDDVSITKRGPRLCDDAKDCDCSRTATHEVWIDLRSNGTQIRVGWFCVTHARLRAERVKDGLPEVSS